ncbi:MAG: dinitrogenase iron-molybdenum cofactor biosynthesis protein [Candidatus Eisenbacteria bacterium]|nr:dinitrogenase iron-molybdenum cofactor biosynthesis protein [Candidatus Eisenbacteria bacterium]
MKIAVTSTGKEPDANLDPRFGRAGYFIIYDTGTQRFETLDNQENVNAAQGAGIQAAQDVAEHGAGCVITGRCGPKAFRTLQTAGIKIYEASGGTVRQAIEDCTSGRLRPVTSPTAAGHGV